MLGVPLGVGRPLLWPPPQVAASRATPARAALGTVRAQIALRAVAAMALGSLAVPAVSIGLASPGSFGQVPAYWVSAADSLSARAANQAVLPEPGSAVHPSTRVS